MSEAPRQSSPFRDNLGKSSIKKEKDQANECPCWLTIFPANNVSPEEVYLCKYVIRLTHVTDMSDFSKPDSGFAKIYQENRFSLAVTFPQSQLIRPHIYVTRPYLVCTSESWYKPVGEPAKIIPRNLRKKIPRNQAISRLQLRPYNKFYPGFSTGRYPPAGIKISSKVGNLQPFLPEIRMAGRWCERGACLGVIIYGPAVQVKKGWKVASIILARVKLENWAESETLLWSDKHAVHIVIPSLGGGELCQSVSPRPWRKWSRRRWKVYHQLI